MAANRIKPGPVPHHSGRIPPAKAPDEAASTIRFSFKHLDLANEKFHTDKCEASYLEKFIVRLRDLCKITVREFRTNLSGSIRSHRIEFSRTSEAAGFTSLNEQLRAEEAWQFEITKSQHGRVHGLLVLDTFYIVWIDPEHRLYDGRK